MVRVPSHWEAELYHLYLAALDESFVVQESGQDVRANL